jgi:hypothetical protein
MLEELAEAIGEEAALRLLETRGGTRVYIPHQPKATDSLAASIGLSAAIGLSQIYGGDRIEVPNPTPRKVRVLNCDRRVSALTRSRTNSDALGDGFSRCLQMRTRDGAATPNGRTAHRPRRLARGAAAEKNLRQGIEDGDLFPPVTISPHVCLAYRRPDRSFVGMA